MPPAYAGRAAPVFKRLIKSVFGRDGSPAKDDPAYAEAARLLEAYVEETSKIENPWSADFQGLRSAKAMNNAEPATRVHLLGLA